MQQEILFKDRTWLNATKILSWRSPSKTTWSTPIVIYISQITKTFGLKFVDWIKQRNKRYSTTTVIRKQNFSPGWPPLMKSSTETTVMRWSWLLSWSTHSFGVASRPVWSWAVFEMRMKCKNKIKTANSDWFWRICFLWWDWNSSLIACRENSYWCFMMFFWRSKPLKCRHSLSFFSFKSILQHAKISFNWINSSRIQMRDPRCQFIMIFFCSSLRKSSRRFWKECSKS